MFMFRLISFCRWFPVTSHRYCGMQIDVKDVGYVIVSFSEIDPYVLHLSSFVCRTMISRTIAKIISIALAALE